MTVSRYRVPPFFALSCPAPRPAMRNSSSHDALRWDVPHLVPSLWVYKYPETDEGPRE
jgi:hypothetical protein